MAFIKNVLTPQGFTAGYWRLEHALVFAFGKTEYKFALYVGKEEAQDGAERISGHDMAKTVDGVPAPQPGEAESATNAFKRACYVHAKGGIDYFADADDDK